MTPTLLEFVVAVMLLWLAWQAGLLLAPHVRAYFRRLTRPEKPAPTATDRAAAAFRTVSQEPPHANDN